MISQDVTWSSDIPDFPSTEMAPPVGAEFMDSTEFWTRTLLDEPKKQPPPELVATLDQILLSLMES
jgi:hypothetical protein